MARSTSSDDCCICFKSTVATTVDKKKRLVLLGASAQPVRDVIQSFFLESLDVPNFFFDTHFHASDYICSSCILLLTNYNKARKRFKELEEEVKGH